MPMTQCSLRQTLLRQCAAVNARLLPEALAGQELGYDHPPRLAHELGHPLMAQRLEVAAHPVEPQIRGAGHEEQLWLGRDQRVALMLGIAEPHCRLVPGERDIDD